MEIKCKKHPKYLARFNPRSECIWCWWVYYYKVSDNLDTFKIAWEKQVEKLEKVWFKIQEIEKGVSFKEN